MDDDSKTLLRFIQDNIMDKPGQELVFMAQDVKEIKYAERKMARLLEELCKEGFIEEGYFYNNDKARVRLSIKSSDKSDKKNQAAANDYLEKDEEDPIIVNEYLKIEFIKEKLENIHKTVMDKFIKRRCQDTETVLKNNKQYSDLFQYFINVTSDDGRQEQTIENLFEFVRKKIDKSESENYIKICGPDGTGKNTFLSMLYIYLYDCFCKEQMKEYPFYINLHYYDSQIIEAGSMEELNGIVKENINEDMRALIELSNQYKGIHLLIIIDGNDKYRRTNLELSATLQENIKKIRGHKKIICIGEKTNVHEYRAREDNVYIDNMTTHTFRFSPIYINEKDKWTEVIEKYCKIIGKESQRDKIIQCISRFNIKEIDHNLLTIFGDCSKRHDLDKICSISQLYYNYCIDYLGMSETRLGTSVELSYEYFMTKEFIAQERIANNWREWELVHQHKTISNYLLARYYSALILDCKPQNVEQLQCVFTNGINVFLKSILNETRKKQKSTINFCKIMFEQGDYRAQAQAAYLVGRIKDTNLQEDAKKLLKEQKEKCVIRNQDITQYFLYRSILVSLLYLGDYDAGAVLLKHLLGSFPMNEVNRAFHLQYYEDVILNPDEINLKDEGTKPIEYTSGVLFNYIDNLLLIKAPKWSRKQKYELQVLLFTLCSLIQVRMNLQIESKLLSRLKKVISKTMNDARSVLKDDMLTYLQMLNEDIDHGSYRIGHLYDELYHLKDIERRGWKAKIESGSVQVKRYENVVEHTYYTWLLGMLYLPDEPPQGEEYQGYDKTKILNCILIHDLAETYVGDKIPEESTDAHRKKENDYMCRIFMHDKYQGFGNMDIYRNAWDMFVQNANDINQKIAREMDIIQAIYQFCIYSRNGAKFRDGKEEEWRDEKDRIKTDIGWSILNEVVLSKFDDIMSNEENV